MESEIKPNHLVEFAASPRLGRASQAADHSQRGVSAFFISSNGDNQVAGVISGPFHFRNSGRREALDAQYGEVSAGVAPDYFRWEPIAGTRGDHDAVIVTQRVLGGNHYLGRPMNTARIESRAAMHGDDRGRRRFD
jgi:hypothetical protein